MKISRIGIVILIALASSAFMCACKEEEIHKTRFGQTDATTDGNVLISIYGEREEPEEEAGETSGGLSKTAKQLDIEDLPSGIKKMTGICDAINLACVAQYKAYSFEDSDFMWHCVHMYVCNCTDRDMGFERVGDSIDADPNIINDVMYAMFGQIRELPQAATVMEEDEKGHAHMRISNDLRYRFYYEGRNASASETRRVTQYSDSSLEMEVALVDRETGEETVDFIYTMRANTRDTTTSALFEYEVTGVRPADKITSDKMSGIPFLSPVRQIYGYDTYGKDDCKYAGVEEILTFNSFKEHVPGMDELKESISRDIIGFSEIPIGDESWNEIISYPVTTDETVEVATTFATYPNDSGDPDIRCYNYDKKKNRVMDKNDALSFCGVTEDDLVQSISSLWEKDHEAEPIYSIEYKGFIVKKDGSADLFYRLDVTDETQKVRKRLIAYNSGSGKLRRIREGDPVFTDDETDEMKPPLTHGRKDR